MPGKHRIPLPWTLRRRTSSQQRLENTLNAPNVESKKPEDDQVPLIGETKQDRRSSDNASAHSNSELASSRTPSPSRRSLEATVLIEQEGQATHDPQPTPAATRDNAPVTWRSLPRKDQLTILTLARLAEPLSQTSLQAYMFYMIKSFDEEQSDSQIAQQAGLLAAAFTAAQCLTAVWWGRLADKEWFGRKNVLLVGLVGTFVSTLGFGFSRSFASAMFFRLFGGALNGNVGVMRTMISEIIKEKKFQPKAFLLLPVTFNVGVLLGPVLGGWLQNPAELYPTVFGNVQWLRTFPYALPNLLMSCVFVFSLCLVFFGLEETHIDRRHRPDAGLQTTRWLLRLLRRPFTRHAYSALSDPSANPDDVELPAHRNPSPTTTTNTPPHKPRPKLPYRRIFTPNVLATLLCAGLLHTHVAAFNALWFVFLSTPRHDPLHPTPTVPPQHLPFTFTGGLGLPPQRIGFAIGLIGVLGLSLQFGLYSFAVSRLGLLRTYRLSILLTFPLVYTLAPYLALMPTRTPAPAPADGLPVWAAITALLLLQVLGRTFVLPITQILVNNCTPHPSVLGAVHGIGQSVTSGCRTVGPVAVSAIYGVGLKRGVVGVAWWVMALEAVFGAAAAWGLREGSGHEIFLEGD